MFERILNWEADIEWRIRSLLVYSVGNHATTVHATNSVNLLWLSIIILLTREPVRIPNWFVVGRGVVCLERLMKAKRKASPDEKSIPFR